MQEGGVVRHTQERETPLPLELSIREQTKDQEIPLEPNVCDKKMGKNTGKPMPTSLDPLHGDGWRTNLTVSCLCEHNLAIPSQSGCTRDHSRISQPANALLTDTLAFPSVVGHKEKCFHV